MSQINKNTCTERSRSIPEGWIETTLGKVVEMNMNSISKDFKYKEVYYLDKLL